MARKIEVEILGDSKSLERAFSRSARSAKGFGGDVERASRGALAASLSFRGLGRSLTFASAQFLGGAGIAFALKDTISQAEESQRVLGQTAVAVRRSGLAWTAYSKQVQAAALAQSSISGFDDERLLGTFSTFVRRTGDVTTALQRNALAADVARGRNIGLEQAAQLVLKASLGQAGALRRVGIAAKQGSTGLQLIDQLQRKYAGSAEAYGRTAAGAQDRFRVAVGNLQETLGNSALPTITKYLDVGATWLNQTQNQARVQRDLGEAVGAVEAVVHDASRVWQTFADAVGGSKTAIRALTGSLLAFKALSIGRTVLEMSKAYRGLAAAELLASRNSRLPFAAPGGTGTGPGPVIVGKGGIPGKDLRAPSGLSQLAELAKFLPLLSFPDQRKLTPAEVQKLLGIKKSTGIAGGALAQLLGKPGPFANLVQQAPRIDQTSLGLPTNLHGKIAQFSNLDFTLPFKLQMEQVKASTEAQSVAAAKDVKAFTEAAIKSGKLSRQGLLGAYSELGQATQTISASVTAAAEQAKETAKAAADVAAQAKALREAFTVPLKLQLKEAIASASKSTVDDKAAAAAIKASAQRALKEGRLSTEGQISAWQTIASANDTLRQAVDKQAGNLTKFAKTSTRKLTEGLGLSNDVRKALELRLAAVGPGGTIPRKGIAAFGVATDNSVHIAHVDVHGVQDVRSLRNKLEKEAARGRSNQRRGPSSAR
jgi:hypothetical protein